ncbi:MAG: penicillin-binding protein 2 [Anaerolineae bacterium]
MYRRDQLPQAALQEQDLELEPHRPTGFIWLFGILVTLAFLVLVLKLYQIQVVQGADFLKAGERQRYRELNTLAPRGVIYDRNGKILVQNEPTFKVSITPNDLPEDRQDEVLKKLSSFIDAPMKTTLESDTPDPLGSLASDVTRSYVSPKRNPGLSELVDQGRSTDPFASVLVKTNIPRPIAFMLQERSSEFPGVKVDVDPIRDYPEGTLLAHLLGYVGHIPRETYSDYQSRAYLPTDLVGLSGLELTYEDQLRGQAGRRQVEVDVNGTEMRLLAEDQPTPGNNLYLTIDVDLQRKVQAALEKGMKAKNAQQGVAIVENPNNGEILAMVSLPSFDNNLFAQGIKLPQYQALSQDPARPLVDHAISGQYPPGSVFKLVAASGALQEGVIDDKMTLFDPGVLYVPNKYFPDDQRLAQPFYNWFRPGFGPLTLRGAIAESCDTCFYKLVGGYTDFTTPLGQALESDYARQFGYGSPTGIDLPGEGPGLIPDPKWKRLTWNEAWVTGDTYNMAIGQGFVLATPLQVVGMTAIVANGGVLYRPHLVRQIVNASGTLTNTLSPQVTRRLQIDDKNFALVRAGMRDAVTYGTAWKVNLAQVAVAGKTGTAEFYGPRVNGNLPTHAWFTAFAPYDKPEVAVVVFVNNGGEGSEVAAPIAADILRAYFNLPDNAPLALPNAKPPPPEKSQATGTGIGGQTAPPPPQIQPSRRFVGHISSVQDAGDHERPVVDGKVVDSAGRGLGGISVTMDTGDGNAVMTVVTTADGAFYFADVDFHRAARWYVRMTTPVDSATVAVDVQPYKQYNLVFTATGQ